MKIAPLLHLMFGRHAKTDEDREAAYHLRVTLIVAVMLLAGAVLGWAAEPLRVWRWLPFGVAYVVGGWRIALDGWADLKHARLNIDFLMGAAAVGAAIVGAPLEGVILIFLFSLSKALEAYAMGRTRHAIAALMDLRPTEATLADDGGRDIGRVAVDDLVPGQLILVRPGERVAADGRVRSGSTEIDQSAITGEAMPVRKDTGDDVYAGTINQAGSLVVEVTRHAGETMLAKIVRLVEEAREERAPAQNFIDRFAHPYTLGVVVITIIAAVVPPLLFEATWGDAFYRAMTLLVVASPCALVISTPSAILSGIANGARHGILFKGGAYLDLAGRIDAIAFDKTGTLTVGRPAVLDVRTEVGAADELVRLAAAVEHASEHHLARAVTEEANERGLVVPQAEQFQSFPGEGVHGAVEGQIVWVGNANMAERQQAELTTSLQEWTDAQTALGRSVVYAGADRSTLGALSFGDELKPGVEAAVHQLRRSGISWITVLSGDHPDAVRAVTAGMGADDVRAGLLPDEKVEVIRQLVADGRAVAMVGDGVNDAPAMASATIGIAMGAIGTDVAIETADVVLMSDEIDRIGYALQLARRARRVVRQNVWFSIGWMLFLVVLALTIELPLPLAVVGHEGSTLLVAANGLRLLRGRPHASTDESCARTPIGPEPDVVRT